jgi:hypothetical protein
MVGRYQFDWGDGTVDSIGPFDRLLDQLGHEERCKPGLSGVVRHTYANPGTYTLRLNGTFPDMQVSRGDQSTYTVVVSPDRTATVKQH